MRHFASSALFLDDGFQIVNPLGTRLGCVLGYFQAELHVGSFRRSAKVKVRGIPHLAKNERDMGHPTILGREKDGDWVIFWSNR
jgi:hypothetical protein